MCFTCGSHGVVGAVVLGFWVAGAEHSGGGLTDVTTERRPIAAGSGKTAAVTTTPADSRCATSVSLYRRRHTFTSLSLCHSPVPNPLSLSPSVSIDLCLLTILFDIQHATDSHSCSAHLLPGVL